MEKCVPATKSKERDTGTTNFIVGNVFPVRGELQETLRPKLIRICVFLGVAQG